MTQEKDEDKGTDTMSHEPGAGKGEEMVSNQGKEPGRFDKEEDSETGRPSGGSTARDSTSVNDEAEEPIDPAMPNMPPA